jgi:hypothetical protein
MGNFLILLFYLLALTSFQTPKEASQFAPENIKVKNDQSNSTELKNKSKVEELNALIEEVGFIELPYAAHYPMEIDSNYITNCTKEHPAIFDLLIGCHNDLVGFIPDTTNFFALLYINLETSETPRIITFNKKGDKIDDKLITEQNSWLFPGEIIENEEYTMINSDLSLQYRFLMIHDYESFDGEEENIRFKQFEEGVKDSIVYKRFKYRYKKKGEIKSNGVIKFDSLIRVNNGEVVPLEND